MLLETNWVLRSRYSFEESAIADAFTKLLGLDNVDVEDESSVVDALDLAARGIELADALHLASRRPDGPSVPVQATSLTCIALDSRLRASDAIDMPLTTLCLL